MSAGESSPLLFLSDGSSLSKPQSLNKMRATLTPPTNHPLVDKGSRTFVVDLTLVDGGLRESREKNCKSAGEDGHSPPTPKAFTTDSGESAGLDTAINPPGLPTPVDGTAVKSDDEALLSAEKGHEVAAMMASEQPTRPATPIPNPISDIFSLSGLATLRTLIPDALLPDDLLVYDPDNITKLCLDKSQPQRDPPVRYVRIFANLKASCQGSTSQKSAFASRFPGNPMRTAYLYLKYDNRLGTGSHSTVYSAPLRLRLNTESGEERTVRVAVKTACAECGAHTTLDLEAKIYNAFPPHLMDDQYPAGTASMPNGVKPDAAAPPDGTESIAQANAAAAALECSQKCAIARRAPKPIPAVVPKFYGYYAAVDADGCVIEHSHSNGFCGPDDVCPVSWPTRILLLEECGKPIVPENHTVEQRADCLKLIKRLQAAGFVQKSMYVRNVLVQPGPLSAPPEARSDATPSFRIIDFGRGEAFLHLLPGCQAYISARASCKEEERKAKDRVLKCDEMS